MHAAALLPFVENRTFDEIVVGETASLSHRVTQRDIDLFATVTGDVNPTHVDQGYARTEMVHGVIVHGMWAAGLMSAVLGTKLPGPGTLYLGQDLSFHHPVSIGDTVTAKLTVSGKNSETGTVTLDGVCTNQDGLAVVTGRADVRAPTQKIRRPRIAMPDIRVERHDRMRALVDRAAGGAPVVTAVVCPIGPASLGGALEAMRAGLIAPILVGPAEAIRAAATLLGADLSGLRLVDVPDGPGAAETAVALVRGGEAGMLMKGDLHTDELMHAVVASGTGLRTRKRLSHVFLMDVPDHPRLLFVTDAAINISPTLEEKAGIVRNAIELAHLLGIDEPRVAILAAVETINPLMSSTLDAAALCKMADRGQIEGALLDGPLALDNAISEAAAKDKGIVSTVAGRADILLVPDLEAGNMLAKELTFLSGAEAAGVVLGALVPIVLTSRADTAKTRLASCAVAVLMARARTAA